MECSGILVGWALLPLRRAFLPNRLRRSCVTTLQKLLLSSLCASSSTRFYLKMLCYDNFDGYQYADACEVIMRRSTTADRIQFYRIRVELMQII